MSSKVDRIVGGKFAPKPVPWQISIRADATTGHWCGGTILDKNTILSAGKERNQLIHTSFYETTKYYFPCSPLLL